MIMQGDSNERNPIMKEPTITPEAQSADAEAKPITGTDGKRYAAKRPKLSPEAKRERDEKAAIRRSVKRLEMFCSSFHQFVAVATNQYGTRELLLDRLVPSDLQIILDAEKRFTCTT